MRQVLAQLLVPAGISQLGPQGGQCHHPLHTLSAFPLGSFSAFIRRHIHSGASLHD